MPQQPTRQRSSHGPLEPTTMRSHDTAAASQQLLLNGGRRHARDNNGGGNVEGDVREDSGREQTADAGRRRTTQTGATTNAARAGQPQDISNQQPARDNTRGKHSNQQRGATPLAHTGLATTASQKWHPKPAQTSPQPSLTAAPKPGRRNTSSVGATSSHQQPTGGADGGAGNSRACRGPTKRRGGRRNRQHSGQRSTAPGGSNQPSPATTPAGRRETAQRGQRALADRGEAQAKGHTA